MFQSVVIVIALHVQLTVLKVLVLFYSKFIYVYRVSQKNFWTTFGLSMRMRVNVCVYPTWGQLIFIGFKFNKPNMVGWKKYVLLCNEELVIQIQLQRRIQNNRTTRQSSMGESNVSRNYQYSRKKCSPSQMFDYV